MAGFADWMAGLRVCVAGLGVSGPPAARVLTGLGAVVTAVDSGDDAERKQVAAELAAAGIAVRLGRDATVALPEGTELVVTSPGWPPDAPLLVAAAAAGVPVIGDTELAWRLRPELPGGGEQAWLAVTGTNGKTTTVRMLALILAAAGHRSIAAGNVGTSLVEVVTQAEPYPVVAVELSSFQLYWSSTIRPFAAAVLNVASHHLDWHGGVASYAAAKARIFAPGTIAIGNADDERSAAMARAAGADVAGGAGSAGRVSGAGGAGGVSGVSGAIGAIGVNSAGVAGGTRGTDGTGRVVLFRLGEPGPGELGVSGGFLVDRAFGDPGGTRLAAVTDLLGPDPAAGARAPAPHTVADALAAAALARAYGVPAGAVSAGLRGFRSDPHRISLVATVGGVDFVDDSKATNSHAAAASLGSFGSVVWVAGGLLKGADADLDEMVRKAAPRLRGVVLLGADRGKIAAALARHAPDIPVVEASGTDTGVMDLVVAKAAGLAEPGDTVLLAPAAQSFDMFRDYPTRGDAFAAAVRRLAAGR